MKRLVWGIVLVVTGLSAALGMLTNRGRPADPGGLVVAILMIAGGGTMIAFGIAAERRKVRIMDAAFASWRRTGRIETPDVAAHCGVSTLTVRQLLTREQAMGVLPKEAPVDEPRALAVEAGGAR